MVGVCSFLLIAYWYSRIQANKSAIKAILMNRIGDWGYSIGLYIIYSLFGNWDLTLLQSLTPIIFIANEKIIVLTTICLLIGAMGKSAQLGLHTWLADAMEGPTPVSALIHAATMVQCKNSTYLNNSDRIYNNIDSKTLNNFNQKKSLNPWFITGYTDAEGSFSIKISKPKHNSQFYISLIFSICAEQNKPNLILMKKFKEFFNVGFISKSGNMYLYQVISQNDLYIIRKHFEQYPLQSTKLIYFKLWCKVMDIMKNKEHLTKEGFLKILEIKSIFPKGLSILVKKYYTNIPKFIIPESEFYSNPKIEPLNGYWIAGFVNRDGSFGLNYLKNKNKLGYGCNPSFRITQHLRNLILLNRIAYTLKCGDIKPPYSNRDRTEFFVTKLKNLTEIIIPFFNKYTLWGPKSIDFQDFCEGIELINKKKHLTKEGLEKIKIIYKRMNSFRKFI